MENNDENEISKIILDVAFKVHKELDPGLFESVCETIMESEWIKEYGLKIQRQFPIPVIWKGERMDIGFRSDVIVEIKSIESLGPVHPKQVLTYLRLTGLKLGLLINFNEALLKNGIKHIVNNL